MSIPSNPIPEVSILTQKLQEIKESAIGFKYVTDALINRADKNESAINELRAVIARFENQNIRTDERIANIERYVDSMRNDIRSVRNAVVGSIIAATFIGIAGLAFAGLLVQKQPYQNGQPSTMKLK